MSPSTINSRKPSPFRPESSEMKGDVNDLLRIITIAVALLILLIPISMSGKPTYSVVSEPVLEDHSIFAEGENFIHYSLPTASQPIATGTVSGYNGFAYVDESDNRLYFVDLVQTVTLDIALPVGDKHLGNGLIGHDVDLDGNTEFFLHNQVGLTYYLLMVDIDNATVSEYEMPFTYPAVQGVGIFNGDAYPDLVIQSTSSRANYLTLDVYSNATLGTFTTIYSDILCIGRFASTTQDSIAMVNSAGTTLYRNITVVNANGTQIVNDIVTTRINDMEVFHYGSGLDELVAFDSDGYTTVYSGPTLGVIYSVLVDLVSSTMSYIVTGNFNLDSQEDFATANRYSEMVYFRNGMDGSYIQETPNLYLFNKKAIGVGQMDRDSIDDIVIGRTLGALGTIRGSDGNYANLEYLIDIQMNPGGHQILTIDVNADGKDDTFCRNAEDLFLVLSDTIAPTITSLPINPIHPTVLDDYVTIKVHINETTNIEYADIWMKAPGSMIWMQPQDEMYASHTEGIYYAFIGDLMPGEYEYYIIAQDSYLNDGELGNATHPLTFSVAGDFVWQADYSQTSYVHKSVRQSDRGNLSDGSSVIYTLERRTIDGNLTLNQYSQFGGNLSSLTIEVPFKEEFSNFAVYTAMLDGDNVLDVIVLDYHWDSGSILRHHAYQGGSLALLGEGTCPYPYKDFGLIQVYDDDQDGNEELFLVSGTEPFSILKLDSDLSWSGVNLVFFDDNLYTPQDFSFVESSTPGQSYIGVMRGAVQIDIYNAVSLTHQESLRIDWPGYSNIESIALASRYNATAGEEQFVAGINYWNGVDPTTRIFSFNPLTTNVNDTPIYELPHEAITYIHTHDTQGDASEELFILSSSGELRLAAPSTTLNPLWVLPITGADPLSSMIADFDGDSTGEFLLFTDQDELLTSVSFTGSVEWTMQVGEVYHPYAIGDIDGIPGVEIGAYPFASVNSMILGSIRNLDTHYVLNVTATYSSADIVQGDAFHVNVTVLNIYGESINDATVYMSAHFVSPEGPASSTFGFYFDLPVNKYRASTDATWSIGIANLSIFIEHDFYHTFEKIYVDAVTIRSDLHLSVQIPDLVIQGEGMTVEVLVQDNLGSPVRGATVSVIIEGVGQTATQSGPYYVVTIPEVDLEAGMHNVSAVATHTYGTGVGFNQETFTAQILTTDLLVATDFPTTINQDDLVSAWFNITDPYGNPITNALVSLRSGPEGFTLIESTVVPGSYRFNHNITLGLGNHTFEIKVDKQFLFGPAVAQIEFDVLGILEPNVFYETRVAGGSMFNVHVFVKDKYGPVFTGTSVTITINGTEYTQTNADGNPDYDFLVPANFLLGSNNFMINVTAAYGNAWSHNYLIRAYSDALGSTTVYPEGEWIVDQGEQTEFQVLLEDWLGRPVQGASITMFVKAVSYRLYAVGPGHYAANITTVGWAPGEYQYTVSVGHEDIVTGEPITGNITILGSLDVFIDYNPDTPMQGGPLTISISVADKYGNPVPSLEISVTMLNMPTMYAEETDQVGQYVVFIEHLPDTEGYGIKNISLGIQGQFIEPAELSGSFTLAVAPPHIEAMGVEAIGTCTGLSFLFSLLGMFLYFRLAPTLRKAGTTKDELEKSVKRMDRLYLLIVLVSAAGLVGSMGLYSIGDYGGALILTVVLLGSSVLLYGLWLYRDAVSAVMVKGSLNRKRMIAGLWHLVFVPVVIILILTYGAEINWFKAYMIDNAFVIGDLRIPAIMTTIFTAYLSSILVVVVNLYREVSSGLKKLKKMEDANTPASIMEDERDTMVSRYSSSIRIKFVMFLVIVGAAAVTTMDFLQNYELGIIVLMPVAFLVVIPFISSKIVKVINQATSIKIRKSDSDIESYED
ncbi:MAG: hypothetical protein E4H14_04395 [Candidatus Thorarchaeota archaeon]|nr:MAG: hypothetical protein E4H14_04395 [Candidatus Thorarchaeota archaeon]